MSIRSSTFTSEFYKSIINIIKESENGLTIREIAQKFYCISEIDDSLIYSIKSRVAKLLKANKLLVNKRGKNVSVYSINLYK